MNRRHGVIVRCLLIITALFALGTISSPMPAFADGCTLPPCGALTNNTNTIILVKWADDDRTWLYDWVQPHTTKGGWWNDGIDVDYFYVPTGCSFTGGIGGTPYTWGPGWQKISSNQTAVINGIYC